MFLREVRNDQKIIGDLKEKFQNLSMTDLLGLIQLMIPLKK